MFFALPDGNGLLYNVTGTAEGPKPINNVQREVPCKTPYTEFVDSHQLAAATAKVCHVLIVKIIRRLGFFKKRLLFASQSWC